MTRGICIRSWSAPLLIALAALTALTGADARAQSFCSSDGQTQPARLLERCPVPVLVLPVTAEVETDTIPSPIAATVAQWSRDLLAGLAPAARSHPYMPKN